MNRTILAVLATLALLAGIALGAEERRITISVNPRFQHASMGAGVARIEVKVGGPKNPYNRRIRVEVDGPKFRAFEQDCSLPEGACQGIWSIRDLPSGSYVAAVGLLAWEPTGKPGEGEWKQYTDRFEFQILE